MRIPIISFVPGSMKISTRNPTLINTLFISFYILTFVTYFYIHPKKGSYSVQRMAHFPRTFDAQR